MECDDEIDMPSQILMIGIIVGVFLAGIGIGYAIFQSSNQSNFTMMTPQQMTQMMNNPQQMTQWHQVMMSNPQAMNQFMNTMMSNPQYQQQMYQNMFSNQQFMQGMMSNPQFQNQWMMNSTMMGGNMMGGNTTEMMQGNIMLQLIQDPATRKEMIKLMKEHVSEMDELLSSNLTDQEFNVKMSELMQKHMQSTQNLMNNTKIQNQWMMNSTMMGGNMMDYGMMGAPITKQSDVITTINKIESILDQVSASYHRGDKDTAFSQATSAYLENYEYIESAIAAKDLKQMEKVELLLRVDLRHLIQSSQSEDTINAKIDSIKAELESTKKLFS